MFLNKPVYKLREWVDIDKLDWRLLSSNKNVIDLLEQNIDKINWSNLSDNPNAIHLLEKNPDKIRWSLLSLNPNAIHLLEKNPDKIHWRHISKNPNIFILDYFKMREKMKNYGIAEELMKATGNPERLFKMSEKHDIPFDELMDILWPSDL